MAESRLQRWSRKKSEALKQAEAPAPAAEPVTPELSAEAQELAINEALPEQELLQKYDLPNPDSIELGTDITGFMSKEIPEFLRRKALRGLWKSNPVLAVLDGLNDYDEDFTDAATAGKAVQTIYKVGRGLVDKAAKAEAPDQPQAETEAETEAQPEASEATPTVEIAESSKSDIAIEPSSTTHRMEEDVATKRFADAESSETQAGPEPRYRARMRFDD